MQERVLRLQEWATAHGRTMGPITAEKVIEAAEDCRHRHSDDVPFELGLEGGTLMTTAGEVLQVAGPA